MINSVIYSLLYGPIAVALGCCLLFTIQAARANKEAVVGVLREDRRRLDRRQPLPPVVRR